MSQAVYNVLFVCADNSALSILAEAILNNLATGKSRFKAYSAGSVEAKQVNSFALEQVRSAGLPSFGMHSKSWNEFTGPDAARMDFVFVVGDQIATKQIPIWPGNPLTAQWSMADPESMGGTDSDKRRAFSQAFIYLYNRINIFSSLPIDKLDRIGLQRRLDEIGHRSE